MSKPIFPIRGNKFSQIENEINILGTVVKNEVKSPLKRIRGYTARKIACNMKERKNSISTRKIQNHNISTQ